MSQINNKTPKPQRSAPFEHLNPRKNKAPEPKPTIGQTYGERRQKTGLSEGPFFNGFIQRAKDFFLGGKKSNNIEDFANTKDRYEGVKNYSNPTVERSTRLYQGTTVQARAPHTSVDPYLGCLNSVIQYLDSKPKKV